MGTPSNVLTSLGVTADNIPVFEYTYVHWFRNLENVPMSVPLEVLLQPLYEVELSSCIEDLPEDESEEVRASHKEILVDSLTNVRNFISSYGVIVRDFFDQDKNRFNPDAPMKGSSKGGKLQQFPALGGKRQGKSGSTNKPKEPTPLPKQGESEPSSKPKEAAIATPLKLQSPPAKLGGAAPPVVVKQPATPKAKADAITATDQPKAKADAITATDQPKGKADAVAAADPPKAEGQPKPPLTLASQKRSLDFGAPSKPEKPPSQLQVDVAAQEDDEDADFQAALRESLKAPSSPQPESGAQSSAPKPATD